jgi:hypothetical protein
MVSNERAPQDLRSANTLAVRHFPLFLEANCGQILKSNIFIPCLQRIILTGQQFDIDEWEDATE